MTSAYERFDRRVDAARRSSAYTNFERVRERIFRMKDLAASADAEPSAYWREELASFEYLLDASPLVVERLRHHSYHVTGLRAYDYRSHRDAAARALERKLRALVKVRGDSLLVQEPPILGGFGFTIDGGLYNVDTLKFFEALLALDCAGLIEPLRNTAQRPVVLEVGAGWGGLAYQMKTLFPGLSYVIVDLPELFLFSATYLLTAFPECRAAFYGDADFDAVVERGDADFVFVPNGALELLRPPRVDLALNLVSFQEMRSDQVETYARCLHEIGCPWVYSLNRERSFYNPELTGVSSILARWYELREVRVLPVDYTEPFTRGAVLRRRLARTARRVAPVLARPDLRYRHLVGARR